MEVKIEKLDNFGRGIAYLNNKICFIENALPNEIVKIKIKKENSKYIEAEVEEYIEKSFLRIEEECPYSHICGGCHLNHICFNEENKFKKQKINNILKKYAEIDSSLIEPIAYHERNHYRNKITLHGKDKELGLYHPETNDIIPIQQCILVNDKINEVLRYLQNANEEIDEAMIKTSNDNSQVMLSIKGNIENIDSLLTYCNVLIINDTCITKENRITTTIGNRKYYESEHSFFQINNTLTKELYDEVLKEVSKKNHNTVLDLYCGTGTIGIYVSDYCNKIIGIDNNKSNIEDANLNKELNQVENIEYICDDVENKINTFDNIDLIIVDPPRKGLDINTINHLKRINPETIIYVSCDPVTLARDIKILKDKYEVKYIKPFNMFPRTYHVETVSVLYRKTIEK